MPAMLLTRAVVAVCECLAAMTSRIMGFAGPCRACRVVVLVLIGTVVAACKGGTDGISGPASAASRFLTERPGQQLAVGVLSDNITPLRWDSDDEIVYAGLDGASAAVARAELRAIRVGSGAVRVVAAAPNRDASYSGFATTRDGRHTFFLLGGALYYAVADSAPLLVANGIPYSNWGGISLLEGTASGNIVFSTAPDSAWIFDAATRTKRLLATGCEAVVTGSPDGRQVLCIGSTSRATSIIDVGSGAVSAGSTIAGPEVDDTPLHWGPRGVERIRSSPYAADIINLATGAALTIIPSAERQPIDVTNRDRPDPSSFAWSKDGKRIGYRRDLCYSPGLSICERSQSQVYVFDVETKETRLAAVINGVLVDNITFSPDGARIAYLAYGGGASSAVYVVARP